MTRGRRRGVVLLAVLVLVGCAVFVVTGIVFLVRGEVAGAKNSVDGAQLRAATWSAVQAYASRLAAQRDRVLRGDNPIVEPSIVLWEANDETAHAALLPVSPDGARFVGEASRIELRTATALALTSTGAVGDDVAAAILGARDAAGGAAVQPESLLGAGQGAVTLEALYGPLDELTLALDDDEAVRSGEALERLLAGSVQPRGLADLLTGFAEEPSFRASGEPKLHVAGEWTDERRGAFEVALGSGAASLLEGVTKETANPTLGNLFAAWRGKHPEPKDWLTFLDAMAADDRPVIVGRLDIMRAMPSALRSLPGIDDERAARITREREALGEEERSTPAWLVTRGILTADEFAAIVDRVTTRSFLWRLRIHVWLAPPGDDAVSEDRRFAVIDAVIDLSDRVPRVAWMRDVSSLEAAVSILASAPSAPSEPMGEAVEPIAEDEVSVEPPAPEEPSTVAPAEEATPAPSDTSEPAKPRYPRGAGRWRRTQDVGE
ncbi:MAG: hypothetical protein JNM94_04690 [Phycisphaerae bacterium]|nr:hypothetical protein [Phycisphaerae bacterium]